MAILLLNLSKCFAGYLFRSVNQFAVNQWWRCRPTASSRTRFASIEVFSRAISFALAIIVLSISGGHSWVKKLRACVRAEDKVDACARPHPTKPLR